MDTRGRVQLGVIPPNFTPATGAGVGRSPLSLALGLRPALRLAGPGSSAFWRKVGQGCEDALEHLALSRDYMFLEPSSVCERETIGDVG